MEHAAETEITGARGGGKERRRVGGVDGRERQVCGQWVEVAMRGLEGRWRRWRRWEPRARGKGGEAGSHGSPAGTKGEDGVAVG